jgi:hypothetical protein
MEIATVTVPVTATADRQEVNANKPVPFGPGWRLYAIGFGFRDPSGTAGIRMGMLKVQGSIRDEGGNRIVATQGWMYSGVDPTQDYPGIPVREGDICQCRVWATAAVVVTATFRFMRARRG